MARIDDLTITLRAIDTTRNVVDNFRNRLGGIAGAAKLVTTGFKAVGAAAVAAFAAGVANGKEVFDELIRMGRLLGTNTQEADAFFKVFRDANPMATIDGLTDGVLTLKERFTEARVETGELFNFAKDFGLTFNESVKGATAQTLEFLNMLKQLPDAGDRVATAIAVMGDEGARQFIPMLQNMEDLNALTDSLSKKISEVPDVIDAGKIKAVMDYKESVGQLSAAWDLFSQEAFALVAPALEWINEKLAQFVSWVTAGIRSLGEFFGIFDEYSVTPASTIEGAKDQLLDLTEALALETDKLKELDDLRGSSTGGITGMVDAAKGLVPFIDSASESYENQLATIMSIKSAIASIESDISIKEAVASASGGNTTKIDIEKAAVVARNQISETINSKPIEIKAFKVVSVIGGEEGEFLQSLDAQTGFGGASSEDFGSRFNTGEIGGLDGFCSGIEAANDPIIRLQENLGHLGSAMGSFSDIAASNGSKSVKAFQKIQIALSTISTFAGAANALTGPFPANLSAFATIVATGLGAVRSIKNLRTSTTSSSTPSINQAPTGPLGGTAPQINESIPQRNVTVNIQGNGTFTADQVQDLIETINDTDTGTRINSNRIAA